MYYDPEKADHAIKFIKNLKHTKGIWRGTKFTVLPAGSGGADILGTVRDKATGSTPPPIRSTQENGQV